MYLYTEELNKAKKLFNEKANTNYYVKIDSICDIIKSYGPNFALAVLPSGETVAIPEVNFKGFARGKTGKHDLRFLSQVYIDKIHCLEFKGKMSFEGLWMLPNQHEIDAQYKHKICSNI